MSSQGQLVMRMESARDGPIGDRGPDNSVPSMVVRGYELVCLTHVVENPAAGADRR
jgi:hypothetical protein